MLDEVTEQAYVSALNIAADQTGLADSVFPAESPFDFEEGMTELVEWTQS